MRKILFIEIDENGIHAQVEGNITDVMCMATKALTVSQKAIEKHPQVSKDDSIDLINEVIKTYRRENNRKKSTLPRTLIRFVKKF